MKLAAIPTVASADELHRRLNAFRGAVQYHSRTIGLAEVDAKGHEDSFGNDKQLWRRDSQTGNVKRGDALYFTLKGLDIRPKGPDLPGYQQPIVAETPPAATVVLIVDPRSKRLLVDMKTEPGGDPDRNYTSLAPSIQASSSRIQAAKQSGEDAGLPLLGVIAGLGGHGIEAQQDGGRFLNKRINLKIVYVRPDLVSAAYSPSLLWVKKKHLSDALIQNECNEFLLQALGLLALDLKPKKKIPGPQMFTGAFKNISWFKTTSSSTQKL